MAKKIEFASEHEHVDLPKPAKSYVPDWYKKSVKWVSGKPSLEQKERGIKHCVPFLDGMTNGYIVELWQDVEVKQVNGKAQLNWNVHPPVAEVREKPALPEEALPKGYSDVHYIWRFPFSLKTPKGYSILVTHPLNRFDLPFMTLSALVDSDGGLHPGNIPFFLEEGFEGIIPMGTPIMQLIPVKRESWKSTENKALVKEGALWILNSHRVVSGAYKALKWKKKDFQ